MAKQRKPRNRNVSQEFSVTPSDSNGKSKQDAGKNLVPTLMATSGIKSDTDISSYTAEFQMTVEITVTEFSTKKASMLLALASYKAVHEGVDYGLYLSMEFLYSYLWKSGHDPMETADEKVRKTLVLSDVILSFIRGKWLTFAEREELPDEVKTEILQLNWLPNERTIQSWRPYWKLETFLRIKTVPLDVHWNRNKYSAAERYSGYTKGYGNDGSPASPGKTKPTRELDGDDTEKPPPQFSLQEFEDYQTAIRLIEYSKAARRQKK